MRDPQYAHSKWQRDRDSGGRISWGGPNVGRAGEFKNNKYAPISQGNQS